MTIELVILFPMRRHDKSTLAVDENPKSRDIFACLLLQLKCLINARGRRGNAREIWIAMAIDWNVESSKSQSKNWPEIKRFRLSMMRDRGKERGMWTIRKRKGKDLKIYPISHNYVVLIGVGSIKSWTMLIWSLCQWFPT